MSEIGDLAEKLKGTPYEFMYSEHPTPTTSRYVFQHVTVLSRSEALSVISIAQAHILMGDAFWSDGSPYTSGFYPENMKDLD